MKLSNEEIINLTEKTIKLMHIVFNCVRMYVGLFLYMLKIYL